MKTRPAVLVAALATLLMLAACGGEDEPRTDPGKEVTTEPVTPTTSPTKAATTEPAAKTLAMKIRGDKITPIGASLDLGIDEKLVITIDSDRAGELHVHSTPEQEIDFDAGTSRAAIVIDRPGVVDVEEHEADKVIVKLKVS